MNKVLGKLKSLFLENLALKITALVITILLSLFVRIDKDAVVTIDVGIVYELPDHLAMVNEGPQTVKLTIRGKWSRLRELTNEDLGKLKIDASKEGQYPYYFSSEQIKLPLGLKIESFNPQNITLNVERKISKIVTIHPNIAGQPPKGYFVTEKITPSTVEVTGLRSAVENVGAAYTQPVDITNRTESFKVPVELYIEARNVLYDKSKIFMLDVEITAILTHKAFNNIPVSVVGTTYNYELKPNKEVTVTLEGPEDILKSFSGDNLIAAIDAHEEDMLPPNEYRKTVAIENVPEGLRIVEIHPKVFIIKTISHPKIEEPEPILPNIPGPEPDHTNPDDKNTPEDSSTEDTNTTDSKNSDNDIDSN